MNDKNAQRLALAMIAEIHTHLGIKNGVNSRLVSKALWHGNDWAIDWEHSFLLEPEENPAHVKHVVDVLDMWSFIEQAYASLTEKEKEQYLSKVKPFGAPSFPGFDGNNESEYLSAARFLIEDLNRYQNFHDRVDLNSHHPTLETSQRMLAVFLPMRRDIGHANKDHLTLDDLLAIHEARKHR